MNNLEDVVKYLETRQKNSMDCMILQTSKQDKRDAKERYLELSEITRVIKNAYMINEAKKRLTNSAKTNQAEIVN